MLKKIPHPAEAFNRVRRVVFSCAHNPARGFNEAFRWLDGYFQRNEIDQAGYTGLRAELAFYRDNRQKYSLTPAGDMGEKCDFAGSFAGKPSRFDVTTNASFKHFSDYEPFMRDGSGYHIVHCDKDSLKVLDIISLAFEPCDCGGWLVPFVAMLPENYNDDGESSWTHSQQHVRRCTACEEIEHLDVFDHGWMPPPSEHESELRRARDFSGLGPGERQALETQIAQDQRDYEDDCYRYFRQAFDLSIMALAERQYHLTHSDGDGFWEVCFPIVNPAMTGLFPKTIDPF